MSDNLHDHDMDDFDDCPNCGGEGVIYICFSEYACVDPESGCEDCAQRCDWCAVRSPSVPVDEVDNGDK